MLKQRKRESQRTSTSVIISTYNQPEWLELVLAGFQAQTRQPDEILIADDGSRPETAACIDRFRAHAELPVEHLRHEDRGFRKNKILNRAIISASGDYLIFTDGDCVPRRDFVETHVALARPNTFLSGGYIKLPRSTSCAISLDDIRTGRIFSVEWLSRHKTVAGSRVRRLGYPRWLAHTADLGTPTRATWNGHNSSTWKHLLIRVNGFDERMGYGGEDRELGERLKRSGVKSRQIRHRALCIHLDHDRGYVNRQRQSFNRLLRQHNSSESATTTAYGLGEDHLREADGPLPVSLVVIAKNEENCIARCLDSTSIVTEKLVVDCGSTDRTVSIAEAHGARVVQSTWRGYGRQRNFAAAQAKHDWILMLDADEWLSSKLELELEVLLPSILSSRSAGLTLPRTAVYLGQPLRHYRSMVMQPIARLYNRNRARWTEPAVHERLEATAPFRKANSVMFHEICNSAYDHQQQLLAYGELKARDQIAVGKRVSPRLLPFVYPSVFFRKFFLQLAILDGLRGFILAHDEAQYATFKRIRILEQTQSPPVPVVPSTMKTSSSGA